MEVKLNTFLILALVRGDCRLHRPPGNSTLWTWSCTCLRAGHDAMEKRKISYPWLESNYGSSVVYPGNCGLIPGSINCKTENQVPNYLKLRWKEYKGDDEYYVTNSFHRSGLLHSGTWRRLLNANVSKKLVAIFTVVGTATLTLLLRRMRKSASFPEARAPICKYTRCHIPGECRPDTHGCWELQNFHWWLRRLCFCHSVV